MKTRIALAASALGLVAVTGCCGASGSSSASGSASAASGSSGSSSAAAQDSLYGAWTMTSLEAATNGTFAKVPYSGQIIFTPSGRMSTQAKNLVPNAPDTDYTVGGYESYYGALSVDEASHTFTVKIESSSSNVLVGRQAVRRYTITDNKLVITPQDASEGWRVTYQRVPG